MTPAEEALQEIQRKVTEQSDDPEIWETLIAYKIRKELKALHDVIEKHSIEILEKRNLQ